MFVAHQGRMQQSNLHVRPGRAVLSAPPTLLRWTVRAVVGCLALAAAFSAQAASSEDVPAALHGFLDQHCFSCHDTETKKGDLDLQTAAFAPDQAKNMTLWVTVHDRVRDGEMPPKKKPRPEAGELQAFLDALARPLIAADLAREARDGRSTWRRLNRYEYENSLRDLLQAPWLQVKEILPEDGESHRFNKIGDALDISHVQMAQYLAAAEYALRQVIATQATRPEMIKSGTMRASRALHRPHEVQRVQPQSGARDLPGARLRRPARGAQRQAADQRPQEPRPGGHGGGGEQLRADRGQIRPLHRAHGRAVPAALLRRIGVGRPGPDPGQGPHWWTPDLDLVSAGRRAEPISIYGESRPRLLRWLGGFDAAPEATIHELEVTLIKGETIRVDAARLFRSRPPAWHNPLAQKDGQPGVAFRWMEVEGPVLEGWPRAGHKLLFGDLPLKPGSDGAAGMEAVSDHPEADAERLLRTFMQHAYRAPVEDRDLQRYLGVVRKAIASGSSFSEAMIAGYAGVLCSPAFVCLEEKPGQLDDHALAARLSYFLWNSPPDDDPAPAAAKDELHRPEVLTAQTERMLDDARARRFVDAFLDYWLDLRKIDATSPDAGLYPDYYLDDLLVESAPQETREFFAELLRDDLPARNIVIRDFAMLNERLAKHYGIAGVDGVRHAQGARCRRTACAAGS